MVIDSLKLLMNSPSVSLHQPPTK